MPRQLVDLSSHLNQTVTRGHPADFPVGLKPLFYPTDDCFRAVLHRVAVVREDTGEPIATVSDRYTLVRHQRILDIVQEAIAPLDVGLVPRGLFVDRRGARMRALFKFPALAQPIVPGDTICPCLKIQNTYDGTSRITLHIGAFRFVCTNLAVGGGGVFAGGFMSIHAGEIAIDQVAEQLVGYLSSFEAIVALYRFWREIAFGEENAQMLLNQIPEKPRTTIAGGIKALPEPSVYDAYNLGTRFATHQMRSYRTAFNLLTLVNRIFQDHFPMPTAAVTSAAV